MQTMGIRITRTGLLSCMASFCLCTVAGAVDIELVSSGSYSQGYDAGRPPNARYVLTSEDLGGFDPAGSDKLVLAFSGEGIGTSYDEVSYGGRNLTSVGVVESTIRHAHLFYLDDPPTNSTLVVDLTGGNGVGLAVMAFSNAGEGHVSPPESSESTSTSLTTTNKNALVVAGAVNNDSTGCPPQSPLILVYSGEAGSSGHGSGYQIVPAAGTTVNPTFPTALAVIAVEFPPAPPKGTVVILK